MRRRTWMLIAAAIALGAFALSRLQTSNPNVLLITINACRPDRLGCYGAAAGATPALDGLAAGGVVFERAYAAAPISLPSHASLFTGLYPPEHGVRDNTGERLSEEIPTLAELLQQSGYETAAFVGTAALNRESGLAQGFDTYDEPQADPEDSRAACPGFSALRAGDEVVSSALSWLTGRQQKPVFCWVNLCDPEMAAAGQADPQVEARNYDKRIAFADQQVQRLVDFLDEQGLRHKTIVIVAGAHGEGLGDHGERTHGYLLYNSTIQVPLIVSQPGRIVTGHRVVEPVSLTDTVPSVLEWLTITAPKQVRGTSFVAAFQGESVGSRICYAETEAGYLRHRWAPLYSVITNDWKYIWSQNPELYDVRQDAGETHDLAKTIDGQAEDLDLMLAGMSREMVPYGSVMAGLSGLDRTVMQSMGDTDSHAYKVRSLDLKSLTDVPTMMPHANRLEQACERMQARDFSSAVEILEQIVADVPEFASALALLEDCRRARAESAPKSADTGAE